MSTWTRTVVVPAGTRVGTSQDVEVLHTYPNGDRLVRTSAPANEAARDEEVPVRTGLELEHADARIIQEARAKSPNTEAARLWRGRVLREGTRPKKSDVLAYVELIGPADDRWLEELRALGVEPLRYNPENTYLCRGTEDAFRKAEKRAFVQHITPVTTELKPAANLREAGETPVWIIIAGAPDESKSVLDELLSHSGVRINDVDELEPVDVNSRIRARVSRDAHAAVLAHPLVVGTEPYAPRIVEDEIAGLILAGQYSSAGVPAGSYLRWLENHAISGQGVTIGIVDAGIDTSHPAYSGRVRDLNGGAKDWHGTFVAGHAAGCYLAEKDEKQFIYGLGTAPKAHMLSQDNQSSPASLCKETVTQKAPSGFAGIVQNNSWGQGTANPMTYMSGEAAYDRLVRNADPSSSSAKPLVICFSAGNSGPSGLTRPKAAKNVIVTGNSENFRPGVGLTDSDNINDVYSGDQASSYGNCGDKRVRPDLVTPGQWTASANYDSHPGEVEYISPKLTWGGGTSGASPKTAGACALLIQWWRRFNDGQTPSPAMLRALLVNGAVRITTGGHVPNNRQGWGRLNLDNILREDVHRRYVDQSILLTARGQKKEWRMYVSDPSKPVKITLAWTDPPGNVGSGTESVSAVVNKLVLRATAGGRKYRGNRFQNSWSVDDTVALTGEQKAGWDNLQNIFLSAGTVTAEFTISVTSLELTTNCFTSQATNPRQDFALVITNGYLDQGASPADLFVVIDEQAKGSAPDAPDAYIDEDDSEGEDPDEQDDDLWEAADDTQPPEDDDGEPFGDSMDDGALIAASGGSDVGETDLGDDDAALTSDDDADTGDADHDDADDADGASYGSSDSSDSDESEDSYDSEDDDAATSDDLEEDDALTPSAVDDAAASDDDDAYSDDEEVEFGDELADARTLYASGGSTDWMDERDESTWGGGGAATDHEELEEDSREAGEESRRATEYRPGGQADLVTDGVRLGVNIAAGAGGNRLFGSSTGTASETTRARKESARVRQTAGATSTARAREATVTRVEREHGAAPQEFTEALARLMEHWAQFAATPDDEPVVRRPAAVLVCGAGTRVKRRDIAALRRLAFVGDLYLVSDDPGILAFLAQRIHRTVGVQYRLADSADRLEVVLRDALAEAGGAQRVDVARSATGSWEIDLIESDTRLILYARHAPNGGLRLHFTPPKGRGPITVSATSKEDRIRVAGHPDGLQVTIDRTSPLVETWAGQWSIRADVGQEGESADGIELLAYVVSTLRIQVRELEGAAAAEATGRDDGPVIEAKGPEGVTLSSMTTHPRVVQSGRAGEQSKAAPQVRAEPPRSRLRQEAMEDAHDDPVAIGDEAPRHRPRAESLGAKLEAPRRRPGATVLDCPTLVQGYDTDGRPFSRWISCSIVRLEPRSRWRRRRLAGRRPVPVTGRVNGARYSDETLTELEVFTGRVLRLMVTADALRTRLARMDREKKLEGRYFTFGLVGMQLVSLVPLRPDAAPTIDPGIEGPLPNPPDVEAPSGAEYPQAWKCIPAKYYRRIEASRGVTHVVCHITDSSGSAEAIAKWFADPEKKVSAHYVIGRKGEVIQCVKHNDIAFHASNANNYSIGIEHVAKQGFAPTPVQYAASAALVRWLCETFGIPVDRRHVIGHAEIDTLTTHRHCPTIAWDWRYYWEMVKNAQSL